MRLFRRADGYTGGCLCELQGGRCWPVEIKTGKNKLNENQKAFVDRWQGPKLVVLRDEHEAIDWACQVATEAA